ncbi:hypothetical protein SEA_ATUIN_323 [Arthrobacter phage Atuin]|nr:hypothetical protein SEA_ATUIN_122 [Arthrobacter phage Atuin]
MITLNKLPEVGEEVTLTDNILTFQDFELSAGSVGRVKGIYGDDVHVSVLCMDRWEFEDTFTVPLEDLPEYLEGFEYVDEED